MHQTKQVKNQPLCFPPSTCFALSLPITVNRHGTVSPLETQEVTLDDPMSLLITSYPSEVFPKIFWDSLTLLLDFLQSVLYNQNHLFSSLKQSVRQTTHTKIYYQPKTGMRREQGCPIEI